MRYELMFPDQVRAAIDRNSPVALAVGVLEYHGERCALGVDGLLVASVLEKIEREWPELVLLPPFYYGAASYAVAPPERNGSVHIDSEVVRQFAGQLFRGLLRVGFRNIRAFVYHQSENFYQGMPTDLAFRLAGRQEIFAFLEKTRGEGWWGDNAMRNYYADLKTDNPFDWIQVYKLTDETIDRETPGDHAGKVETSFMMSVCPEGVDMTRPSNDAWYAAEADKANENLGNHYAAAIYRRLREILFKNGN